MPRGKAGAGPAPAALGDPWRIGREAEEVRGAVLGLGEQLASALGDDRSGAVRETLQALRARLFRIAVVPGTGASATRLASAIGCVPPVMSARFSQKSAIVARLYFGRPGGPRKGGQVRFFGAGDWAEISDKGGRLRGRGTDGGADASEQGGDGAAGSATDALRARLAREVDEMRNRAFMRLGDEYYDLIGETRRLSGARLSETLPYTGAAESGSGAAEAGRFAEMTSEIELFHPAGVFAVPTALVALPGAEPGFEIPWERSAAGLVDADLRLLVIDGTRPLTKEDRALAARLAARFGNSFIVAIDRSGGAAAPRADPAVLARAIASAVEEANGGTEVAVMVVSSETAVAATAKGDRQALGQSGLSALARRLGRMLFWGPSVQALGDAAGALEAIAEGDCMGMRDEIRSISAAVAKGGDAVGQEEVARERRAADLEEALVQARKRLETAMSGLWTSIRSDAARTLRDTARTVATAALGGAGAAALATMPETIRARFDQMLETHRQALLGPFSEGRSAMIAVLAEDFGEESFIDVRSAPFLVDFDDALTAIADVEMPEAREILPRRPSPGDEKQIGDIQRRLMGRYLPAIETVVESATLALGQSARDALAVLHGTLSERNERQVDPEEMERRLPELEGRLEAAEALIGQIASVRAALGQHGG